MTYVVDQAPAGALKFRKESLWDKLFVAFRAKRKARIPRLDPCELSDHLKRDLGFLDGRG